MDVELIEIREFLARHPPFDRLPAAVLDRLPKELTVRYLRRGTAFPPTDGEGEFLYVVRRGAIEWRDRHGALLAKYGEGDLYASVCADDAPGERLRAVTVEDSLFYLLSCSRFHHLCRNHPEFAEHFNQSVRQRLRRALEVLQDSHRNGAGLVGIDVSALVTRSPVAVSPVTTVREAAQTMTREQVSSLLVTEEKRLVGIITDRDLRTRCVAEGRPHDTPVSEVMTGKLHKVSKETPAFEALITMTRLNVHHLPVVDADGIFGMVSSSDLVRHQRSSTVYLVSDLRRCGAPEQLAQVCADLPELQVQMVASGATGYHVGQAISSVTDAATKRLVELAEAELGPPPVPFTWLAVGSHARREQTIHSDQDHALLLSDEFQPEHAAYFERLARYVSDGLAACGFIFCPGKVMATNPEWRQPYHTWRHYFDRWITTPERKSLMLASNFFDMRAVAGDEGLYDRLHAETLQQCRNNKIFLAHLAANSLQTRPPLGFFRNFVMIGDGEHARTLDIKHSALILISDLARIYALSAGLPEIGTRDRLKAAAEARTLSQEGADNLEDAYEFITTLRARHQAEQIKAGLEPDNYLAPSELSALERGHLKDVFSVINTLQNALGQRYQSGRFF